MIKRTSKHGLLECKQVLTIEIRTLDNSNKHCQTYVVKHLSRVNKDNSHACVAMWRDFNAATNLLFGSKMYSTVVVKCSKMQ